MLYHFLTDTVCVQWQPLDCIYTVYTHTHACDLIVFAEQLNEGLKNVKKSSR